MDFELDNRASVPRRTVFCPVARTSKWNPVRGTKPRILVDKLSLEERNIYIRVRAHIHHPPPTFGVLLSRDPYHRFFSADRELSDFSEVVTSKTDHWIEVPFLSVKLNDINQRILLFLCINNTKYNLEIQVSSTSEKRLVE